MAKDTCLLGAVHGAEDRFLAVLQAEVELYFYRVWINNEFNIFSFSLSLVKYFVEVAILKHLCVRVFFCSLSADSCHRKSGTQRTKTRSSLDGIKIKENFLKTEQSHFFVLIFIYG